MQIQPHHQHGIDNLVREYSEDPRFPALIIGGSVAKGLARDDSDVDFMIVATDEEYQSRSESNNLFINRQDLTDYEHGFVDGKIIDMSYLVEVAEKGNDPTRAAFDGAFLAYSRLEGLEGLMKEIHRYPEELRENRIRSFYSMSFIQNWLMAEADRHKNIYTITRAASQLALYAGRLILAYNRVFFPYHKWFISYIEKCEDKPKGLVDKINKVLREPGLESSNELFYCLKDFKDWGITDLEAFTWFMKEVEWSWRDGDPPLEDL